MAKWLNSKLSDYRYGVKSSLEFLHKLKEVNLEGNEIFVTYDFEKLYPSLNITSVSICFYRFLLANSIADQLCPALCREITDLYAIICTSVLKVNITGRPKEYQ